MAGCTLHYPGVGKRPMTGAGARLRLDLAYDGSGVPRLGRPAGPAHRAGRPRAGSRDGAAAARGADVSARAAPTPASTRAARSSTPTCRERGARTVRGGWPAPPQRRPRPPDVRVRRVVRGARRLRRAVLGTVAPLRLPGRRRPRPGRPADARARAGLAAAARPGAMNEAAARPARRARLRGLLQAARGRHHRPDPARPRRGRGTRPGVAVADGAGRRLLPQHGALAGRLPARGRRGPAAVAGPGEVLRGRRARLAVGGGRAGARADPGGGRLPSRRRAGRAGRADAAEARWLTTSTTSPPTRRCRSGGSPFTCEVWGRRLDLVSGSGVYSRGRLDHRHRRAVPRDRAPGAGPDPRPGLRLRRDRARHRHRRPGRGGHRRRRQRAGAPAGPARTPRRSASPTASGRRCPTRCPTTRRTTRSGPTRPSGSARTPCTTCCCAGCRAWRPDGRAVMVVGKNLGGDSLQRWLGDQGYPTTRLASAKGFRVLETRRG